MDEFKEYQGSDDALDSYFQRSAAIVSHLFDRIEQKYAHPLTVLAMESFERRPIFTTFAGLFCALSLLPVVSFLCFAMFVFTSLLFTALACALVTSSIIISFFAALLAITLAFTLFLAGLLTSTLLATYLTLRLFLLLAAHQRRGLGVRAAAQAWSAESAPLFFASGSAQAEGPEAKTGAQREVRVNGVKKEYDTGDEGVYVHDAGHTSEASEASDGVLVGQAEGPLKATAGAGAPGAIAEGEDAPAWREKGTT